MREAISDDVRGICAKYCYNVQVTLTANKKSLACLNFTSEYLNSKSTVYSFVHNICTRNNIFFVRITH